MTNIQDLNRLSPGDPRPTAVTLHRAPGDAIFEANVGAFSHIDPSRTEQGRRRFADDGRGVASYVDVDSASTDAANDRPALGRADVPAAPDRNSLPRLPVSYADNGATLRQVRRASAQSATFMAQVIYQERLGDGLTIERPGEAAGAYARRAAVAFLGNGNIGPMGGAPGKPMNGGGISIVA